MRETKWWAWHMIAGAVILVLLGLHMIVTHFDSIIGYLNPVKDEAGRAGAINWGNVVARAEMVSTAAIYILLLAAALFHGLYGFRTILFELTLSKGAQRFVNVLFWLVGIGMFLFGTWAAIASMNLPVSA
jgi:succinate dehydrogenase hydrophobic anchor subunit